MANDAGKGKVEKDRISEIYNNVKNSKHLAGQVNTKSRPFSARSMRIAAAF